MAQGLRVAALGDRVAAIDEEMLAEDLSLMLRSGLNVVEALRTLEEDAASLRAWVRPLVMALQQGEPLSRALETRVHASTPLVACVKASEATGDLGPSLQRFAANAARLRALRAKLVAASVYPALLITVSGFVVLFLLAYVVPRFAVVLESAGQDLPWVSRLLIDLGQALHAVQGALWLTIVATLGTLGFTLWRMSRTGRLMPWFLSQAAKLPGIRQQVRDFGIGQLARSSAMLTRAGVPALKALDMCRDLLAPGDRVRLARALLAARSGAPLAKSLHEAGVMANRSWRVLRVAEETGRLDEALDRVADIHDAQLERALERWTRLMEPVLMLVIGSVVGGIVVLMYVPIFQLASSIR